MAREQAGLSQRKLAERAGMTQSEIARIESGNPEPSIPTLQRLLAGAGLELRFRLVPCRLARRQRKPKLNDCTHPISDAPHFDDPAVDHPGGLDLHQIRNSS